MIKSLNEHHGFYDGISRGKIASKVSGRLFELAAQAVKKAFGIANDGDAAALLDSRFGRHLSDQVRDAETEEELVEKISRISGERGFVSLAKRELQHIYQTRRENGGSSEYDQQSESVPDLVASLLG